MYYPLRERWQEPNSDFRQNTESRSTAITALSNVGSDTIINTIKVDELPGTFNILLTNSDRMISNADQTKKLGFVVSLFFSSTLLVSFSKFTIIWPMSKIRCKGKQISLV